MCIFWLVQSQEYSLQKLQKSFLIPFLTAAKVSEKWKCNEYVRLNKIWSLLALLLEHIPIVINFSSPFVFQAPFYNLWRSTKMFYEVMNYLRVITEKARICVLCICCELFYLLLYFPKVWQITFLSDLTLIFLNKLPHL